jgi:type I restriction enzyme, R subunit
MNQTPEQRARDSIDRLLAASGWIVQDMSSIDIRAGLGVAVKEYSTDVGPADYVLFAAERPVGIVEAKREEEGQSLSVHEEQAEGYVRARLRYLKSEMLPFVYLSTGTITTFTDFRDPKPRDREVFSFHRPETLDAWVKAGKSLRASLRELGELPTQGLRSCQIEAIRKLEKSLALAKPRALVQMATGAGKTFTAITSVYRLLKHSQARRVLFLVDTKNLGEQAEQEFTAFKPNDDNRMFPSLYGVQRLKSRFIPKDCHVYISTIQRVYSILKGEDLDESAEEANPNESALLDGWKPKEAPRVEYDAELPPEFFDLIIVDECHRSIYNLWRQVLEYFDTFLVGLTATPDQRTFAYFKGNLVSEYTYEMAVADGVNVNHEVFEIETRVGTKGGTVWKGRYVERRDRLTRAKRLELQEADQAYAATQLDRDVVAPDQIRTVLEAFRTHAPELFPDRIASDGSFELPKTLIFAKADSHADDIIRIAREVFDEGNAFCKKVTYRSTEEPKGILADFRNAYNPRIAVTVDMIATGTDVRCLEILVFMRDVRSSGYFEQMKGRGTRVIAFDDLRKVSPAAKLAKDHFVIVDAVGVTKSLKTCMRPLDRQPSVPLRDLLGAVAAGARDEELFTTLAGRLTRLDKRLTEDEREGFEKLSGGRTISQVARALLDAYDPDSEEDQRDDLARKAARPFTGALNNYVEEVRRVHDQIIDRDTLDEVTAAGWSGDLAARDRSVIEAFAAWVQAHRDEYAALRIFYGQPWRRRELTYAMIEELLAKLKADRPELAPSAVWRAYERIEKAEGSPLSELSALVSLVRRAAGIDTALRAYDRTVDRNFQAWVFGRHAGTPRKFSDEQLDWLRMIKDHVVESFHMGVEDLDYTPFDAAGGRGRFWELFGSESQALIAELNEALAG